MSQSFEDWWDGIGDVKSMPWAQVKSGPFLKDPVRLITIDPSLFFSPADGVIVYQEVVEDDQQILPVKGYRYTLSDLMERRFDGRCLVIGIFMTIYDVHVNRMPYAGLLKFRSLTPIISGNRPMDAAENDLFAQHLDDLYRDIGVYLRYNARMVNEVYVPDLDYRYYIAQIADDEVNVITHFTVEQNQWFDQSQRFSFVRWGSQVELVLPFDERYKFETLVSPKRHVKATLDALVRIDHQT